MMLPVMQKNLGAGRVNGDCLAASIASLLELPLDAVPNRIESDDWEDLVSDDLVVHGYRLMFVHRSPETDHALRGCLVLASGESGRGQHCVVWRDGACVHDPHPSQSGLLDVQYFGLLVPIDPGEETPPDPTDADRAFRILRAVHADTEAARTTDDIMSLSARLHRAFEADDYLAALEDALGLREETSDEN